MPKYTIDGIDFAAGADQYEIQMRKRDAYFLSENRLQANT